MVGKVKDLVGKAAGKASTSNTIEFDARGKSSKAGGKKRPEGGEALSHADCLALLSGWIGDKASWEDDKAVLAFFEAEGAVIDEKLGEVRAEFVKKQVNALLDSLPADAKEDLIKSL